MTTRLTASQTPIRTLAASPLVAVPFAFDAIPRAAWDRSLAATPAATPFSRWTYHRAWWDAYSATAHPQYLCCFEPGDAGRHDAVAIRAIVPLMHRHEVEAEDAQTATTFRHSDVRSSPGGAAVPDDAKAIFMAASYHTDYATLLCDPTDLPAVADAVVTYLAGPPDADHGDRDWDVIDLRRLRGSDPALPALEAAFQRLAADHGWDVTVEVEDVCPVVTLADGDWEAYLSSLDKKARHEIRRKIRRAEDVGEIRFEMLEPDAAAVDAFIALHQARWGAEGLFPDTPGGALSRRFIHRLAELEAAEGSGRSLELGQVRVGERIIFATVGFASGATCYFYNAGMDPDARDLSPGVTGTAAYLRDRIAAGVRRFDFLRGNEGYKYEWGAVDEPIHRLLVTRR